MQLPVTNRNKNKILIQFLGDFHKQYAQLVDELHLNKINPLMEDFKEENKEKEKDEIKK